jgi:U4/U6 small nuclear ribonucleoprotein PRP3
MHICVFRVNSLAFNKHRYLMDINAKQYGINGIVILNPKMNLVICEAGEHSMKKYKKLLLDRIKWTDIALPPPRDDNDRGADDPQWMRPIDDNGQLRDNSNNRCVLVFDGEVRSQSFKKWGFKVCETEGEAKEVLARSKLDSLWALAEATE